MEEQTKLSEQEQEMFENSKEGKIPTLDLSEYIGTTAVIIKATPGHKIYPEKTSYYIKYETDIIKTLDNGTEISASKIFGLYKTDEGLIWGDTTPLGLLLKKHGVDHWKGMIGEQVKVQTTPPNKSGKEYLTF